VDAEEVEWWAETGRQPKPFSRFVPLKGERQTK
jgi:hypothetical protein